MAYAIDKRLTELFVSELPVNRRQQLCSYLNAEQVLMSDCGLARDYRGIAQQLDLSYSDIARLEKLCDPFGSLLNDHRAARLSVYELFELLAGIGRYDILDDMIPVILDELSKLKERKRAPSVELILPPRPPETPDQESTLWYDAYVCYADHDVDFVRRLAEYLESPEIGFRLFIRDRDLLGGNWIYETFARLIETQCRRMIIVLSPEFFQSPDCKFQSLFATGLAIEKCSRILVPIIYRPCPDMPSMLRQMSKIDMSSGGDSGTIPQWSMNRLIRSIREPHTSTNSNQLTFGRTRAIAFRQDDATGESGNHSNNHNTQQGPSNHQPPLMVAKDETETFSTIATLQTNNQTWTNVSVITSNADDESTNLIKNPFISTPTGTEQSQDQAGSSSNGPKNWIKSIKRKIKVAL